LRLGILGGTFDPIHYGHLVAAEECRVRLGLDVVLFVPAGQPPHKRGRVISPAEDRVEMVRLAIASNPGFQLSRIEVDRTGPSYTVDTLARLREEYGPAVQLYFVVGMDALSEILTWHHPARIVALCQVVAVTRPGFPGLDLADLEPEIPEARQRITLLEVPELRISASDLRRRVAAGLPIRYQVPEPVEEYIRRRGLYRGDSPG
jgi:nicotinate-nucleotide adenylyltransferase